MKRVIITGGNSGIGFESAKLFKNRGYEVIITGRNEERVSKASEELQVEGIVANMANLQDIKKIANRFSDSSLDVLVNNAALAKFLPIQAHQEMDYEEFFNTNIRGPLALIQHLLPSLERADGAAITNVSSVVTNNGLLNASLYAACKGAMDAFTKSLALELAEKKIRVNCVAPGAVDTPLLDKLGIPPEIAVQAREHLESTIPLKRYANPDEIASVIVAQSEATYSTGSIWNIDGGVSAI